MEKYNLLILLFAIAVFVSYYILVLVRFGIQPSISESYYRFPIGANVLFPMFISCISASVIIVGNTPLMFLAGLLLAFVGCAPAFKIEQQGVVHVIGAEGGIILGLASMWIDFHMPIIPIIMFVFTVFALPKNLPGKLFDHWLNGIKNYTWWVETVAFVSIITGLIIAKI